MYSYIQMPKGKYNIHHSSTHKLIVKYVRVGLQILILYVSQCQLYVEHPVCITNSRRGMSNINMRVQVHGQYNLTLCTV